MSVRIETIRECLEGIIPGHIATCDAEGIPNLAYFSRVQYIDNEHVALSYQFFNRTRQNILGHSPVRSLLTSHLTGAQYWLSLQYLRTETAGPLFEQMKAKLAGIASHEGMSGVFRLLGSDIYRILSIQQIPGPTVAPPPPPVNYLSALRRAAGRLGGCGNLECLLETALDSLGQRIRHRPRHVADARRGPRPALHAGQPRLSGVRDRLRKSLSAPGSSASAPGNARRSALAS